MKTKESISHEKGKRNYKKIAGEQASLSPPIFLKNKK